LEPSVSMIDDPLDRLVLGPLTPRILSDIPPILACGAKTVPLGVLGDGKSRATWDQSVSLKVWFFGEIRGSAKFDPVS
jgi:hypothetical protein